MELNYIETAILGFLEVVSLIFMWIWICDGWWWMRNQPSVWTARISWCRLQNIGTGTLKTGSAVVGGTTAENAVHERGSVAPEMDARNKHLRDKYSEKPKEDANTEYFAFIKQLAWLDILTKTHQPWKILFLTKEKSNLIIAEKFEDDLNVSSPRCQLILSNKSHIFQND